MNTILKRYKLSFIILILPFFYPACKSDVEQIPGVNVNIALDLNDPSFFDLNSSGNGVEITGGVSGIIIFRKSIDEFRAYDRACPNNPLHEKVHISDRTSIASDSVCGSEFSLLFDGEVLSGPAPYGLKEYYVTYNSGSGMLYINN